VFVCLFFRSKVFKSCKNESGSINDRKEKTGIAYHGQYENFVQHVGQIFKLMLTTSDRQRIPMFQKRILDAFELLKQKQNIESSSC